MRPVVLQMGVTLDGFVHGAKGYEDWGLPPEDDDVVAWKVASLREAGTHIMGRATYEAMASVWPNTTGVYADVMNEIPKVVFSRTLTRADWPETPLGQLTMLKLPRDEFVTIELVHDPTQGEVNVSTGLSHFVIKVEAMDATISELAERGIDADVPVSPDGSDDFRTTWVIDPD